MHRSTDGFRPCLSADSARRLKNEKNGGGGNRCGNPLQMWQFQRGFRIDFFENRVVLRRTDAPKKSIKKSADNTFFYRFYCLWVLILCLGHQDTTTPEHASLFTDDRYRTPAAPTAIHTMHSQSQSCTH